MLLDCFIRPKTGDEFVILYELKSTVRGITPKQP